MSRTRTENIAIIESTYAPDASGGNPIGRSMLAASKNQLSVTDSETARWRIDETDETLETLADACLARADSDEETI